jgi:hypothetical protein
MPTLCSTGQWPLQSGRSASSNGRKTGNVLESVRLGVDFVPEFPFCSDVLSSDLFGSSLMLESGVREKFAVMPSRVRVFRGHSGIEIPADVWSLIISSSSSSSEWILPAYVGIGISANVWFFQAYHQSELCVNTEVFVMKCVFLFGFSTCLPFGYLLRFFFVCRYRYLCKCFDTYLRIPKVVLPAIVGGLSQSFFTASLKLAPGTWWTSNLLGSGLLAWQNWPLLIGNVADAGTCLFKERVPGRSMPATLWLEGLAPARPKSPTDEVAAQWTHSIDIPFEFALFWRKINNSEKISLKKDVFHVRIH